jgi:hypothetical protein
MFKKLFSRDLPAAKAYQAAQLSAAGETGLAEKIHEGDQVCARAFFSEAEVLVTAFWLVVSRTAKDGKSIDLFPFTDAEPMRR